MITVKCPVCNKEFNATANAFSLAYKIKVWDFNDKRVEIGCYIADCTGCKEELIFKNPINARPAKNVEINFKDLSRAVDDFIENNSNILNIGFHDFLK